MDAGRFKAAKPENSLQAPEKPAAPGPEFAFIFKKNEFPY